MIKVTKLSEEERLHENAILDCVKTAPWNPNWPPQCFTCDSKELIKSKAFAINYAFQHAKVLFEKKVEAAAAEPEEEEDDSEKPEKNDDDSDMSDITFGIPTSPEDKLGYNLDDIKKFLEALPSCYPFTMHQKVPPQHPNINVKMCYCPVGGRLQGWKDKFEVFFPPPPDTYNNRKGEKRVYESCNQSFTISGLKKHMQSCKKKNSIS